MLPRMEGRRKKMGAKKNVAYDGFFSSQGAECQLRHDECEVADCGGRGKCVAGKCECARGWTGEDCSQGERNELAFSQVSKQAILLTRCLFFSGLPRSSLFRPRILHFRQMRLQERLEGRRLRTGNA